MAKYFITGPDIPGDEAIGPIEAESRVDALYAAGLSSSHGITVWTEAEWNEPVMLKIRQDMKRDSDAMRQELAKYWK